MAFPRPTDVPQQAVHPPDISYQHTLSAPIAQDIVSWPGLMSHPDVQTLKQQLDIALRKISEHENTSALF
jgi:hypothetical protein